MGPQLTPLGLIGLLAGVVVALPILLYGLPFTVRRFSVRRLKARCKQEGALVLSFDDGPGPSLTPRILDLLAARGVHATFFPLGERARRSPELLDRVIAEGHEVGCHSERHLHAVRHGPFAALRDALTGVHSLSRWLTHPLLFRPPYGKLDLVTWIALSFRGIRLGWWTLDSGDTAPTRDIEHLNELVRRNRGGVVLLHDFDRVSGHDQHVLELLSRLLDQARDEGLRVVPLRSVLE